MTSLRSQYSRIYLTPSGVDEAVVGSTPLNYQDTNGAWQPIDDTLQADTSSGFAWKNTADSYTAEFPASLAAGPVRLSEGGQWVSFQLDGASSATGTVSGNTITYANALPGMTVTYASTPVGVKETLTLASASAASGYSYAMSTSSGLAASLLSSVVSLTGAAGSLFGTIGQASVTDADNNQSELYTGVTDALSALTHGYLFSETLDSAWLHDAARAFPVTIDPTITLATPTALDCTMWSGHPSTVCTSDSYSVAGYKNDGYNTRRSLTQFNFTGVPEEAKVVQANWAFYTNYLQNTTSEKLDVFENQQKWDSSADWTNATTSSSTTAWSGIGSPSASSAGGGNLKSSAYPTGNKIFTTTLGTSNTGWNYLPITSMAQDWLDHQVSSADGMLVEADNESNTGLYSWDSSWSASNQDYLDLYYVASDGADGIQTYTSQALTDQATLKVDPANGNLLLATTDMHVAGTGNGGDLSFKHYYNSEDAYRSYLNGTASTSQLGTGWTTDNSLDSTATVYDNTDGGSATVIMPGGVPQVFTKNSASGSFNAPPGVHGDLSHDDTSHTTKFVDHDSGLTYRWSGGSGSTPTSAEVDQLTSITTPTGNTITFAKTGSDEQVTDTKGRLFDENQGPAYSGGPTVLKSITDEHGNRTVSFGYNNSGQLTSYTDATGAVTDYGYDANGMLNDIHDPSTGHDTAITYRSTSQSDPGKVNTITQTTTDCAHGSTVQQYVTTYTYAAYSGTGHNGATDVTTVTDPNGVQTLYYWDHKRRVVETDDAAGHVQSTSYDNTSGQVSSFTDNVSTANTTLSYDTSGQLSQATEPQTNSHAASAFKVDSRSDDTPSDTNYQGPAKLPTETTDAEGNNTYYHVAEDGTDDVTRVAKYLSGSGDSAISDVQQLGYNGNGTIASATNSNTAGGGTGQATTYAYDSNANLASITPPAPQGATTYTEDADNRLASKTDAVGHTTTYSYDGDDRPTRVTFSDGTYIAYTYDTDGNLTQRRNRDGTTDTITYDGLNRPTAQSYNGENESFCYNPDSRLTSVTTAVGTANPDTVTYSYNYAQYLDAVGEPGSSNCAQYNTTTFLPTSGSGCIAIAENGDNKPTAIAYPGGVVRTVNYTNSGKTSEIKVVNGSTTDEDLKFSYDSDGCTAIGSSSDTSNEYDQLQCTRDAGNTTPDTTYGYDPAERLTSANHVETSTGSSPTSQNESWNLDTEGNISEYSAGGTNTFYGFNADDELCWSGATNNTSGNTDGTGSATGNGCTATPTGGTSYTYNNNGDITGANNGFTASYDAADTTTSINNIDNGGTSLAATYADYGQTDRITLGSTSFTNSILGLAASGTGPGGQRIDFTRLPTGQLLSMRVGTIPAGGMGSYNPTTSTNSYYAMVDQQESVLGLTDHTGAVDAQYRYNPYGRQLAATGTAATTNPMRWDGAYFDSGNNLYHLGARYYSPTLERFLTTDPKHHQLDPTQQDTYAFGSGDPIDNTDVSGSDSIGETLGGFFVGAAAGFDLGGAVGAVAGAAVGFIAGGPPGAIAGAEVGGYVGANFGTFAGAAYGAAGGDIQNFAPSSDD